MEGVVVRDPGARVEGALCLDGTALIAPPTLVVFYKPVGVQCTVGDPRGRTSLAEVAGDVLVAGLHPVGRLDADSEGLLPFAAMGALTQRLLHPRHGVEKVYIAQVDGRPSEDLAAVLARGVETADGVYTGRVQAIEGDRVTVSVTEGKHRMVRRMLANAGFPVLGLRRVSFGALSLGDLAPGAWRPATAEELRWAREIVS